MGQLLAENFKSERECSAIGLNSTPRSKELGWKQPFDGSESALSCWHGESDPAPRQGSLLFRGAFKERKKSKQTGEGNRALLPRLSSGS